MTRISKISGINPLASTAKEAKAKKAPFSMPGKPEASDGYSLSDKEITPQKGDQRFKAILRRSITS